MDQVPLRVMGVNQGMMEPVPESRTHYPLVTRLLIDLFRSGSLPNVRSVQVEPVYGHVGRVLYRDGSVRFYRGSSLGLNPLGAAEVARDKGYTKHFLERLGYATPRGKVFLFPDCAAAIGRTLDRHGFTGMSLTHEIIEYIEQSLGFPCYLKPNEGSQGRGIEQCATPAEVLAALARSAGEGASTVLVEQAVQDPDYRVLVLDGAVVCAYLRRPLTLIGDGVADIAALLRLHQGRLDAQGRRAVIPFGDPRIDRGLRRHGWDRASVLAPGEQWQVYPVANLSAGGDCEDVTDLMHPRWRDLCVAVTAAMGLRLCGLDLACADIRGGEGAYCILELNASPGLAHYAASGPGPAARVRELYRRVFAGGGTP